MFLGHSGAVCEHRMWVTHTVQIISDRGDVALQSESL